MSNSDVETFQGKIVYNLDGSAYIIDPENATFPNLTTTKARLTFTAEASKLNSSATSSTTSVEVSGVKSSSSSTNHQSPSLLRLGKGSFEAKPAPPHPSPKIHSFRIVSAHDAVNFKCHSTNITGNIGSSNRFDSDKDRSSGGIDDKRTNESDSDNDSDNDNENSTDFRKSQTEQQSFSQKKSRRNSSEVGTAKSGNGRANIQNPILMCFICKLSFGNTKSFSLHAKTEHNLNLQDLEKHLLAREYSSAIIQRNMDEKPQISFLEPLDVQQIIRIEQIPAEVDSQLTESGGDLMMAMDETDAAIDEEINLKDKSKEKEKTTEAGAADDSEAESAVAKAETETEKETEIEAKSSGNTKDTGFAVRADAQAPTSKTNDASNRCKDLNMDSLVPDVDMAELPPLSVSAESSKATELYLEVRKTIARRSSSTSVSSSTPPQETSRNVLSTQSLSPLSSTLQSSLHEDPTHLKFTKPNTDSSTSKSRRNSVNILDFGDTTDKQHQKQSQVALLPLTADTANEIRPFQKQHQQIHPIEGFTASGTGSLIASHQSDAVSTGPNSTTTATAAALSAVALSAALSQHNHLSSLHASLAALTNDPSTNSVKLISEFLQHQLAVQKMQQEYKHSSTSQTCPEHPNIKGVDCKPCEILEVQHHLRSPLTPESSPKQTGNIGGFSSSSSAYLSANTSLPSPTSHLLSNAALATGVSPAQSTNAPTTPTSVVVPTSTTTPAQVSSSSASSFTIGACSEHINGRPLGVDCSRCEMILNSARLNSGVQMSTRNSCKTLKCPQCNWHYKYQETLEIHMREKHPDGESACGYCLAGQQHPRLARGESYSCGYKPYRCEICNYSTTTKGNLSIHMQSDKHLNNMQELNSSQNMVAAAAAAAAAGGSGTAGPGPGVGKIEVSSNMLLGNTMNMQQAVAVAAAAAASTPSQHHHQQQQSHQTTPNSSTNASSISSSASGSSNSNKPKPSFRCDICSYETSVARNLRIHMTSEKHTHNMAVLQNNIKHIQAFSLLQQHQQATAAVVAQQQQQHQQQQHLTAVAATAAGTHTQLGNAMVAGNFLPEVAIADFAYNQALMIQLLHQQQQQQQQTIGNNKSIIKMPPTSPTPPMNDSPVSVSSAHVQHQRHQFSPNNKAYAIEPQSSTSIDLCLSSTFSGDQEDNISTGPTVTTSTKPDPCPKTLYSCLVCEVFNTNSLDDLNQHLLLDRTRQGNCSTSNSDIVLILNNNYICRLCNYKTNLKANFQLHSKTDKHLQKLNFINHIREGGPRNEYKLKLHQQQQQQQTQQQTQQQQQNVIQLKCNCCDYQTNSVQKLSLHAQHMRHETMRLIFHHLLNLLQDNQGKSDNSVTDDKDSLTDAGDDDQQPDGNIDKRQAADNTNNKFAIECQLCNYVAFSLHDMIQHVKSLRHLQVEQFVCFQRRSENLETPTLEDIFRWCGHSKSETAQNSREHCNTDEERGNNIPFTTKAERLSPALQVTDEETISNNFSEVNNGKYNAAFIDQNHILPPIIYKCNNNCDYFSHSKQEIELHFEEVHTNCETNFITIPTNAAAIRAFQAAMAAAAVAAVANSNQHDLESNEDCNKGQENNDDCPIAIKKERIDDRYDEPEPMDQDDVETAKNDNDIHNKVENRLNANDLHEKSVNEHVESDTKNLLANDCSETSSTTTPQPSVQCPLCPDYFTEKDILEMHLMRVHSVSRDGLARLLQLVDKTIWKKISTTTYTPTTTGTMSNTAQSVPVSASPSPSPSPVTGQVSSRITMDAFSGLAGLSEQTPSRPPSTSSIVSTASMQFTQPQIQLPNQSSNQDEFRCQLCCSGFKHEQLLLQHAQKMQHFRIVNGEYACLASSNNVNPCQMVFSNLPSMVAHYKDAHISLVISERHVYKYRCKQCSLAFKTQEKLTTHTLYHTMRDATKCMTCQRNFRSTQALQKHMEQSHGISNSNSRESGPQSDTATDKTSLIDVLNEQAQTSTISNIVQMEANQCYQADLDTCEKSGERVMSPTKDQTLSGINFADLSVQQQQQQQQVAAITAALLKQQHQQHQIQQYSSANSDIGESCNIPSNLNTLEQLPMDANSITQKYLQQQQEQNLSQNLQSLQSLQNLQHLQSQLPQLAAAAAASGIPLNPVDMLNLMQFHHLMSLNFMNLAPPLIFGATAGSTPGNISNATGNATPTMGTRRGSGCVTPTDLPQRSSNVAGPPGLGSSNAPVVSPSDVAGATQLLHQQQQTSPASATQLSNNQKRARTRITDEQLKILRAHFDINNSPSEESIMEMSQKANLPMKVVKHWFRNTLFKERQRNKDSPYNFNNPPSTTLNLEEYERTGQAKVTPLGEFSQALSSSTTSQIPSISEMTSSYQSNGKTSLTGAESVADVEVNINNNPTESQSRLNTVDFLTESHHLENRQLDLIGGDTARSHTSSVGSVSSYAPDVHIKTEPVDDISDLKEPKLQQQSDQQLQNHQQIRQQEQLLNSPAVMFLKHHQQPLNAVSADQQQQQQETELLHEQGPAGANASTSVQQSAMQQQQNSTSYYNSYETKSESGSSDILSRPQTPLANPYASMNDLLSQQIDNLPMNLGNNMGPPKKFQMSKVFEKHSPSSAHFDTNSNSSNSSSTSSGKRANRTRFTDYQIKVLQEFFENNSYPKDSDLEYLSKLLLLSPRVIVVWFQNARQKQRKIYENQPNNSLYESEEKKQNITYACKKCNLVFQRYYELIRHQKNHCFKEENNKKSAKAQIAAAQIAQNLSSEDSNSSMDIHNNNMNAAATGASSLLCGGQHGIAASTSLGSGGGVVATTEISSQHLSFGKSSSSLVDFSPSTTPTPPQRERSNSMENQLHPTKMQKFECDKCKLSFNNYEHFREHQLIHIMNPNLFLTHPTDAFGPFGSILQSLQHAVAANASHHHQQPTTSASSKKRKYSETSSNADDMSSTGASFSGDSSEQQSKRYDFLYQYFLQNESNMESKNQFHAQQQQSQEPEMELEFLWNFYQQNEMRKRNNYDFLYQYYLKNEEQPQQQPNIEFLLQYYQLNESKKFFQLDASTQRIYNCTNQQQQQPIGAKVSASSDKNDTTPAAVAVANNDNCNKDDFDSHYMKRRKQTQNFDMGDDDNVNAEDGVNNEDDFSRSKSHNRRSRSNHGNIENDENINNNQVQDFGCEDYVTSNSKNLMNAKSKNTQDLLSPIPTSPVPAGGTASPSPSTATNSYFHNLDDFLVATMIENNQQTLTFNDANPVAMDSFVTTQPTKGVNDLEKATASPSPNFTTATTMPSSFTVHGTGSATANSTATTTSPHSPMGMEKSIKNNNNDNNKVQQQQQNKRLRTTILPEQLNFLYECYQNESNPSRKMLEEISKKVNLKKRVVQVWFQNSRAKDKKSRNQRFAISDDSNYEDSTKDLNASNSSCNNNKLESLSPQVGTQQHAFSLEHIHKVKQLLEQTTQAMSTHINGNHNDNLNMSVSEKKKDDVVVDGIDVLPSKLQIYNDSLKGIQLFNLQKSQGYNIVNGQKKNSITGEDYENSPLGDVVKLKHYTHLNFHSKGELTVEHGHNDTEYKQVGHIEDDEFSETLTTTTTPTPVSTTMATSHASDIMSQIFNYNQISVMGGK